MESLKVFTISFVAQFESPMLTKPRQTAFHHPTQRSQSAAVASTDLCQQRINASRTAGRDVLRCTIRAITQRNIRFSTRSSAWALNRWHGVEQSDRGLRIMDVGRRRDNHQRYAPRVSQDVTFAAFFRSIRGVRSGVRPPKTARTLALSMMPKDASSCPRCPSTRSSLRWIRGHTPTCVQSRNRRQQAGGCYDHSIS